MNKEAMNGITNFADGFLKKITEQSMSTTSSPETQWKPNVTVAAIIEREGKFLLVEEFSHGRMVFNQPAGHLEEGETLFQAVQREVREETAWSFEPKSVVGVYMHPSPSSPITYLRFCFAGSCHDHDPHLPLDDGIQRAVWMSLEEIRQNTDRLRTPLVLSCINDYLAGNHIPMDYLKHQLRQTAEAN